jgi:hypothetical protein
LNEVGLVLNPTFKENNKDSKEKVLHLIHRPMGLNRFPNQPDSPFLDSTIDSYSMHPLGLSNHRQHLDALIPTSSCPLL